MAGAVVLTLVCDLIAVNFISGEKKIERRIERLNSLEDPRFRHELGVLLGPQFVGGNRQTVLRNGVGIAPQWTGQAQDPDHWRDTHFQVEGPVVAQMFSSSPSGGSESMQLMYLFAITSASHSIDLSASYLVPDDLTLHALVDAMKRCVKLRIVVPGEHMDSETVRSASRARWGALLSSGAVIADTSRRCFTAK